MIGIVGMPGSGKSEFVNIALTLGYRFISMGDIVREETVRKGYPLEESGKVAQKLRDENGLDIIAILTLDKIRKIHDNKFLIEGIRGIKEIERFRMEMDFFLIGIHCSPKIRFERLKNRKRDDDYQTYEEFYTRDLRELSWGLGEALALSDVIINNNSTLEDFKENIYAVIKNYEL
ncbi:MAG: flagellar hook-basal body complex protein FliE [Candidatus Methanofastidiosa archaeon]|jgi:dephospho-CoA kinase|nr:flagellar hook-basal body complex protein FliE [Candidatus Methanofastidiosa archaeon]HOM96518.1 AAA family ATPase [Methanofastidiosum sp.]HPC81452.1 AAA family ATPase [Methanofastidiosum sp.]HRS26513.1 AAA family ATPase [Methanofastidiosum sp.]